MDFLFHKLSEKEKTEIKKQVDSIIKSFSEKLSKIKGEIGENFIEKDKFERDKDGKPLELDRMIMLSNAPEKNNDSIIAERRKW